MTSNTTNALPFERLMAIMTRPWFVTGYFALIIGSFFYLDQPIAFYFQSLDLKANAPFLTLITHTGKNIFYIGFFFLLALFFRYIYRKPLWEKRAWFLWLCVLIPNTICFFLKLLFGRSRPRLMFENDLYGFYGYKMNAAYWSFPSGHTTTVMGLAFGLCIVFPRYAYAFIIAALTVATSRILLTHHFLSDVLLASYLSFIEVAIFYAWLKRKSYASALPVYA